MKTGLSPVFYEATIEQNRFGITCGAAGRSWACLEIILALAEQDVKPDIVCGTTIGTLVSASYAPV